MPEKIIEKVKRLSHDLAESVRSEIELMSSLNHLRGEVLSLRKCITCYVASRENISDEDEAIAFIKGFYEARKESEQDQLNFKFISRD